MRMDATDILKSFLTHSQDMIFIKNVNQEYVVVSKAFAEMMNCTSEMLEGKTDFDFLGKKIARRHFENNETLLKNGIPQINQEELFLDKNGNQRIALTSTYPIYSKKKEIVGMYGIIRDITARKRLENSAMAVNTAKSDFLARMSHDMRTPLNGILGMLHLMEDEVLPESAKDSLNKVIVSCRYLLSLINGILDAGKVEQNSIELQEEVVDSQEVISSLIATMETVIQDKHLTFYHTGTEQMFPFVWADKMRLQQIFTNILTNAVNFTPPGGTIVFGFKNVRETDTDICGQFSIRDTGIGMSKDFLPKIFDFFSQENSLENIQSGNGLGMAVVKKLVDAMHGTIDIKSEKNVGTDVSVCITFKKASIPAVAADADADVNKKWLSGAHILVSEDHPLNTEIAVRLLEKQGCLVTTTVNGKDCCDVFAASPPDFFDAILMDVRMPVMNGYEATQAIRHMTRADAAVIPIIAMTANASDSDRRDSQAVGMNAHIAKPFEPKMLFKTLARHISSRSDRK